MSGLCPETMAKCDKWECKTYAGCEKFAERVGADWSSFALTLDDHRRAYEAILTNYPPAQAIDEETALKIDAHLDAIVGCCNQIDAWVANNADTCARTDRYETVEREILGD